MVTRHHPDAFATEGELNRIPEPVGEIERLGAVLWVATRGCENEPGFEGIVCGRTSCRGPGSLHPVTALDSAAVEVDVRYAKSGDLHIAYHVIGDGPPDLVLVPGFTWHLECAWEHPGFAAMWQRVASFCRLITIDKRGTGLSDRVPNDALPTLVPGEWQLFSARV